MILDACGPCLRRAFLIAHLAPRIAGLLGSGDRRARGLLGLAEDDLIAAAAGRQVERALSFLERLDTDAERERLAEGGFLVACLHSPRYPAHLHDLADPPAVLFGTGCPDALAPRSPTRWAADSAHPVCLWSAASRSASTPRRTEGASMAVACPSRSSPAGRTWSIRAVTGRCMRGCARAVWCCRSCLRGVRRTGGASRRGTGSWRPSLG